MTGDHLSTHGMDDRALPAAAEGRPRSVTLVAVRQGMQWASLSPELGVASCGPTADEALHALQAAIVDLLDFEHDGGARAGAPVPPDELQALLDSHEGAEPVAYRRLDLDHPAEG